MGLPKTEREDCGEVFVPPDFREIKRSIFSPRLVLRRDPAPRKRLRSSGDRQDVAKGLRTRAPGPC